MKKEVILLSCALTIGFMISVSAQTTEEEKVSQIATEQFVEDQYKQIMSAKEMTIEEALDILNEIHTENADILSLREELQTLQQCEGIFVQEKNETGTGKTYTAVVNFTLENGTVMCSVNYDNYSGELGEASVEPLEGEKDYLFVTRPEGTFFKQSHSFEILLGKNDMHIEWGSCEYNLHRADGSAEELEDDKQDFENSEGYAKMIDHYDKIFPSFSHRSKYVEEEKTVYTFVAVGDGKKKQIQQNESFHDAWNSLLDSMTTLTEAYQAAVTLAVRDSIGDITKGHCTVMFVETLKDSDIYDPNSIVGSVSDGEITYNCLEKEDSSFSYNLSDNDSVAENETSNSDISDGLVPTRGEENALDAAYSYLNSMAFSYNGLIKQLKYEGYSQEEATYAVDHCGADWKEQAVKMAESYLEHSAFSHDGLVKQLEYEGFTHAQATYGVDKVY